MKLAAKEATDGEGGRGGGDSRSRSQETLELDKSGDDDYSRQTFEQAFELTGHGKFNHAVLLTCGLIHLNVSMETIGMSYVVPAAECDLRLTNEHKGLLTASAFIGIVCTSFLWGYLGDACGRRGVMLPAMLCSALLSAASAFSVNVWMLLLLRIATGCLVSASSATVYAYLGEMHTSAHRSAAIAWGSVFLSFCFMLLPGLAWFIIPGTWSIHLVGSLSLVPWRVFMLCWSVPCLAAAAALFALPESPKFILAREGAARALPVLASMYAHNHNTTPDCFPVKQLVGVEGREGGGAGRGDLCSAALGVLMLFRPPLLRCVVVAHSCIFAVFMLSSGMYMWVPDILNSLLISESGHSSSVCDILRAKTAALYNLTHLNQTGSAEECASHVSVAVFPISIGMGALFALTYLAIGFLINRIGRKTLYCAIMLCCGAMTVGAGRVPDGGAATALLVLALCSGCAASILAAIAVDVFPTKLRAMSMCVMYMVGRSGAAVGSNVLGAMLGEHCEGAFTLFGAVTMGSALLMLLWPNPERVREQLEKKGFTF